MMSNRLLLVGWIVAVLLLAGCNMNVSTVIHPDGSGTISVILSEAVENTDFIRRMPNMADYLNAWQRSL